MHIGRQKERVRVKTRKYHRGQRTHVSICRSKFCVRRENRKSRRVRSVSHITPPPFQCKYSSVATDTRKAAVEPLQFK